MKTLSLIMRLLLLVFLAFAMLSGCKKEIEDPFVIKPGQFLNILLEDVHEGLNYFHAYVDDIYMEMLVVRIDDTIRTAYNTCERCYVLGHGYFIIDDEDGIFCFQCKMPVDIEEIGVKSSGCHPIPILEDQIVITEDLIQIPYETLSPNTHWFLNWKIEDEPEHDCDNEDDSCSVSEAGIDS